MATNLKDLVLKELSLVDFPANKEAVVSIYKRDMSAAAVESITKMCCADEYAGAKNFADVFACMEARQKYWKACEELYPLMDALSESVRSTVADAAMTAMDKESTIRTSVEGFMVKLREKMPDAEEVLNKFAGDFAGGQIIVKRAGDAHMADQDKELDVLKGQLADLTKQLASAELIAKMSDEEKEFMKEMDDAKKAGFMGMSPEERQAAMKVKKSLDETIVVEGTTISKSAVGDGMFAVMKAQAKRLDDQAADIAKARDAAELATFTKRAADDFGHLVGTDVEKAAVLRHMATATEEVQKTFGAILKSAEDMIKKGFDAKGHSNGRVTVEGSAAEQLDTLAKAHAKDNEMEYAAAYVAVIEKRSDLYELALKEGN